MFIVIVNRYCERGEGTFICVEGGLFSTYTEAEEYANLPKYFSDESVESCQVVPISFSR